MSARLILSWAAGLVPARERAEWLAEWRAEAAFVRHAAGRRRAMSFCAGAFRDAIWLRRNGPPIATGGILESPWQCLALLAALAAGCSLLALRPSGVMRGLDDQPYREPEKLAMVSRAHGRTPSFAKITVEEYRAASQGIPAAEEVAFYAPKLAWADSKRFLVAVASPNLFRLLGVHVPASGLVMRSSAVHRCFRDDPHIVGRKVELDDSAAVVTGVVSDSAWQLPGFIDGWLLDDGRFAALPAATKGYMVVRLREPLASARLEFGEFTLAPPPRQHPLLALLAITLLCLGLWVAVVPFGLGAYVSTRHAWSVRVRRGLFMSVKLVLLIPIVVCGAWGLGVLPISPQAFVMGSILALRWAMADQRSRCPVCLHSLSHPVRIGEASHTFLDWYGTEFVCERGHGFLHVAEVRTSCCAEQRWLYLDPSWS